MGIICYKAVEKVWRNVRGKAGLPTDQEMTPNLDLKE